MGKVTESIFSGTSVVIPLAEVHHIERDMREAFSDVITVVLSGTTWNQKIDSYNNAVYIRHQEAESFLDAWCRYRAELEAETVEDIRPDVPGFEGTLESLSKI